MKFISSNGIDFVVGETITGESKVDVDGNVVAAQAVIQTLGQNFCCVSRVNMDRI